MEDILNKNEFLDYLNTGKTDKSETAIMNSFNYYAQEARKITCEINNNYHNMDEIRELFRKLIQRDLDDDFRLFPPFYTDCGINTHIGKNVFINNDCKFQDQGGIYIGDNVLIGHSVVLATLNHDERIEKRANLIPSPIHIGNDVWIGSMLQFFQE